MVRPAGRLHQPGLPDRDWVIAPDSPLAPDVTALLHHHIALMHAASPPESVHALPVAALAAPGITFLSVRTQAGALLGVGALSPIDARHCEIKSMHIAAAARGQGLARHLLAALLRQARDQGFQRVSLETGIEPVFKAARALYTAAGFTTCPPFEGYGPDPNSVFMTLALDRPNDAQTGPAVP